MLSISASLGKNAILRYCSEGVVVPSSLQHNVFTTSQVDNIDHDPQSTSAVTSFHGTGISILQHPDFEGEGKQIDEQKVEVAKTRTVEALPSYYTDIHPFCLNENKFNVPGGPHHTFSNDESYVAINHNREQEWLNNVTAKLNEDTEESNESVSWSAYNAVKERESKKKIVPTNTVLLPLFRDQAHTIAMLKHAVDIVKKTTNFLNPNQTPVIHGDQPLYALLKQLQFS